MPTMSGPEQWFCRSAPWGAWTRRVVLPWALNGTVLTGDVLEVGAGGGSMALASPSEIRQTLTDIDPKMVAATTKRFGDRPHVKVQEADATQLPFADGSFDFVVTYLMLHHVIGWDDAIAEMRRVLRPGGQLVGYDLTATRLARLLHVVDRSPHQLIAPSDLTASMDAAGFAPIGVTTHFAGHVMRFAARA